MPPLLTLATSSGSAPSSSRRAATPSRVSNLQQEVIVIMIVLRLSHKAQRINILTSRPGEKNNKCYPPSSGTSTRWAEWCPSGIVH